MQIDVRSVRYAQALATHGSISKASAALGIAQPTLSRCLKDLEIRIGLPLFTRHRHGVQPTDFGHVFLDQAARVVAQIADLEREVALARGLKSGEVSLGVGPYVADALMPACIRKFSADHPGVRLRIQMDAPDVLGRALRARTIDIAVAEGSVLEQDASLEVVHRLAPAIPGCFVARTTHPLRAKAAVTMTDLFAYPFAQVINFPPRILKPMLEQRARIRGDLPPFPSIECPSFLLAKCAILESDAVTVATLVLIEEELLAGKLAPILELPWMQSNWMIFKLRGRSLGPAALVLIEELRLAHQAFVRDESALRKKWLRRARPRVPAQKVAPSRSSEK